MTSPALAAEQILRLVAVILVTGSVLGFIARKFHVPDIALFLVAGMVLGPQGAAIISVPAASTLNQLILIAGASFILFDGGASLRTVVLQRVWITVLVLATVGVAITAGITAVAGHEIAALPWPVAMLLGAVLAPTDPATLVPVFKQVKINERLAQTVVSESAANDAVGAILTFVLLDTLLGAGSWSALSVFGSIVREACVGLALGVGVGYVACLFIGSERYGFLQEHSALVTVIVVILAYVGAQALHGSGYMAVFAAGVIFGNKQSLGLAIHPGEQRRLDEFIETTSLMVRIFIFVLLGSQIDISLLLRFAPLAAAIVAAFILIARPLTVFVCAGPDRRAKWTIRELVFMCWTRETGVIPGALASLLLGAHVPGADVIGAVTFTAILATILLQAPTTRWLAAKLGLLH
jgi:potassium/hydrogen antiporter